MAEPDFIVQTEIADDEAKCAWFRAQAMEAAPKGAVHHRASYHPDNFNLILYEGWKVRPGDEGEPRFKVLAQ